MLHNPSATNGESLLQSLDAFAIVQDFAGWCVAWHQDLPEASPDHTLMRLHRTNFDLWHLEDRARDTRASAAVIADTKLHIDHTNQQRNDLVEQFDTTLLATLACCGLPRAGVPLHSETPGLMLDRLSILSLKIFHTAEEAGRTDAPAGHIQRNCERLRVLEEQSRDLTECLSDLWQQVCRGERRFKLYRQMKMYNDPNLNPVLYQT